MVRRSGTCSRLLGCRHCGDSLCEWLLAAWPVRAACCGSCHNGYRDSDRDGNEARTTNPESASGSAPRDNYNHYLHLSLAERVLICDDHLGNTHHNGKCVRVEQFCSLPYIAPALDLRIRRGVARAGDRRHTSIAPAYTLVVGEYIQTSSRRNLLSH